MSSENLDKLIRMLLDQDHRMRAIRKIEALGSKAKGAASDLWDVVVDLDGDPPPEIRAAALKAIVSIDERNPETAKALLNRLEGDPETQVRLQAAQLLGELKPSNKGLLPRLWELLLGETNIDVQSTIARTIIHIDGDEHKLFEQAMQALQSLDTSLAAMMVILPELNLSEGDTELALQALWEVMSQDQPFEIIGPVFIAIVELTADDDAILTRLLSDEEMSAANKSLVITHPNFLNNLSAKFETSKDRLLPIMLGALADHRNWVRDNILQLLKGIAGFGDSLDTVLAAVQKCLNENGQGLGVIYQYEPESARKWLAEHREPKPEVGEFLLLDASQEFVDDQWERDKEATLQHILAALTNPELTNVQLGLMAVDWLKAKSIEIPRDLCERALPELKKAQEKTAEGSSNRYLTQQALDVVEQRLRRYERESLLKDIQSKELPEEQRIKKIKQFVQIGTADALRGLVEVWMTWVVNNLHPACVETTAELVRHNPLAVLPLVDELAKSVPLDDQIRAKVLDEIGTSSAQIAKLLSSKGEVEKFDRSDASLVREWLDSFISKSDKYSDLFQTAKEKGWSPHKQVVEIVHLLEREKQKEFQLLRYQRIASQLADMSDRRFFDDEKQYEAVRVELIKHAVPALVRRLPNESDIQVRESFARALGNLGGREAVDALVRAVIDEERKRAARQELLATYYLEPSKQQSEAAATILRGAVDDAKSTLKLLQNLNLAVFVVGMILLTGGVLSSIFMQDVATRLLGALAGIGGLAGVIVQLINNPLDRIQNAMANLVQIETAFTSFIWELNLNGTYIQSQYVAEGILTNDEVAQTVGRIESAMSLAMNMVAVYTEEGRQRIVTRINSLSPGAGDIHTSLTIQGQHLNGDSSQKKDRPGMIAVNHVPIQAEGVTWKDDEVKFRMPPELTGLAEDGGTVWVSLLIDGMETNALPFHVVKNGA
jgi:HEAT repeat protein